MAREKAKAPYRPAVGDHVMWGKYFDGVVEQVLEVPGKRHSIALVRKYLHDTGMHGTLKSGRLSPGLTTISSGSLKPYKRNRY